MGLYNLVFGNEPGSGALLALLHDRETFNVGRFRDAWVEAEGDRPLIRVHTRNGGGNREDYDDGSMSDHPWYVRDCDDDFDSTYADWWFAPDPTELDHETYVRLVEMAQPPVDMHERWNAVIEAIKAMPGPSGAAS